MELLSPYSPVPTGMLASAKTRTRCSPIKEEVQEVLYYSCLKGEHEQTEGGVETEVSKRCWVF